MNKQQLDKECLQNGITEEELKMKFYENQYNDYQRKNYEYM